LTCHLAGHRPADAWRQTIYIGAVIRIIWINIRTSVSYIGSNKYLNKLRLTVHKHGTHYKGNLAEATIFTNVYSLLLCGGFRDES